MERRYNKKSLQPKIDFLIEKIGLREYETSISQWAQEDPNNVHSWTTANEVSKDLLMKSYYLRQMAECIRRNGNVTSYLKGIFHTHKIGRKDLNRELTDEMIEEHPVSGRLIKIIFHNPLNLLMGNNIFY